MDKIYKMKLHDVLTSSGSGDLYYQIIRVHDGWIYRFYQTTNGFFDSVFVPWKNVEFTEGK